MRLTAALLLLGTLTACNRNACPTGSELVRDPEPRCKISDEALAPPATFSGLFLYDFEDRSFWPETELANNANPENAVWLDVSDEQLSAIVKDSPQPTKFYITIVGRKSTVDGYYGHLGGFGQTIIVSKIVAVAKVQNMGEPE